MQPRTIAYNEDGDPITAYDENGGLLYDPSAPVGGVTLSGLLNVLDGIHSREGMITIMTSNTPDSLDPALIRPGRIDRKVLFGYASAEVTAKLFIHIFEKAPEEAIEGEEQNKKHDIKALSQQFAEAVPPNQLTPAEVQGFLLVHREDPVAAVAQAKEWAEQLLETKAKGANVAAFTASTKTDHADASKKGRVKAKHLRRKDSGFVDARAAQEDNLEDDDLEEDDWISDEEDDDSPREYDDFGIGQGGQQLWGQGTTATWPSSTTGFGYGAQPQCFALSDDQVNSMLPNILRTFNSTAASINAGFATTPPSGLFGTSTTLGAEAPVFVPSQSLPTPPFSRTASGNAVPKAIADAMGGVGGESSSEGGDDGSETSEGKKKGDSEE